MISYNYIVLGLYFSAIHFRSKRLIKRAYYAKTNPETYSIIEDDIACDERLFKCVNCFVVVHEGCYPVGNIPSG